MLKSRGGLALVLCPVLPSRFTLLFYPKSTLFCFFLLAFFSTLLAVFSFSFLPLFGITTGLRTPIIKHPPSHVFRSSPPAKLVKFLLLCPWEPIKKIQPSS
uniref:Uncharacterized protein n=1 Tax=Gossypium raimondii TaxID=29730 RepID=A0A0D2PTN8_GOSRA|nr:hypothetical protein B456_001G190600 [Gossypium raimondii]